MLRVPICRIRLRLKNSQWHFRGYSTAKYHDSVLHRLADKEHRSHFRSLETEARKFKKGCSRGDITLRPSIRNFLVWLHVTRSGELLDRTTRNSQHEIILNAKLGNPVIPSPLKVSAVLEIAMFHFLTGIYTDDEAWFVKLNEHLDALRARLDSNKKFRKRHYLELSTILSQLGIKDGHGAKQQALSSALSCLSCDTSATSSNVVAWIRSLTSASVSQACQQLATLSNIPAFVTSDILLRTPMSKDELYLQIDLWTTFMGSIGQAYHEKTSHTSSIIHNLAYYSIQFDPQALPDLILQTLQYFTSTKSGFKHKLIDYSFVNHLVYSLAYYYIRSSHRASPAAMAVIRSQEHLVKGIGHSNLSQEGFVGIVLAIREVSDVKAVKLFKICQSHFHEMSTFFHIGNIHLSTTPEQLLHSFNSAIAQFPNSASLWLVFVKRLQSLELLTEARAQKLLTEIVTRKDSLILSKDIILTLLQPVDTINGIERFIKTLEDGDLLQMFKSGVVTKYLTLLYRFSTEKNVRKPYLDRYVHSTTNIDCARYLYASIDRKTTSTIGVMLNGEVVHQPQEIYNMYIEELQGKLADENCLVALLRACDIRPQGQVMMWGQLYAPQVAVHEFKTHVAKKLMPASTGGIIASNKLWRLYIQVLSTSDYLAELAEVIRWWEQVQFVPSKSTLMALLKALPRAFAERHIKHARSVPVKETMQKWPWPTLEEFQEFIESK